MLRNCFLPVNYNQTASRTCGEIIYQNIDEFLITCTLCKIKIFEYDEFIGHLKNVHLEELSKGTNANASSKEKKHPHELNKNLEDADHLNYEHKEAEHYIDCNENRDCMDDRGHNEDNVSSDNNDLPDEEYVFSEEENAFDDEELEQEKSIMRKTRKPKEYSCEICDKKYADERRLQMHVKILHLREKPFKCNQCEEAFAEERSLQNHIGNKHTGYDCPTCHKNYSSSRNLKRHMQIHLEVKEFVCPDESCNKAFASKGLLRDHQRCHRNEIFICEECGYKCRQRESLIVHKRHHTGEKPFGCKQCESRFASKPLLKEHMATHETERKHVCDVCGKSFNRPKALYHHKHLHLGIKKFVCKTCGAAYAQAAGLSAHMRKHREEIYGTTSDLSSMKNQENIFKTCSSY